jgi:hypothetical protein
MASTFRVLYNEKKVKILMQLSNKKFQLHTQVTCCLISFSTFYLIMGKKCSILHMKAACASETWVPVYQKHINISSTVT